MLRYASVCSGIEAASVAWEPFGWRPAWFAEIDPFCSALLDARFPNVENRGDFTDVEYGSPVDVLVGGTPCQSFSVAGARVGLDDPRGNLALEFVSLARRLRPRWLVWENVPGVLSVDGGRAFGAFLGALAECGYGFAYRILDARYFGVPQRRRRVFVVAYLGDWRPPAAVLFEHASLCWNPAPGREAREDVTGEPDAGAGVGDVEVSPTLKAWSGRNHIDQPYVARPLLSHGQHIDYETETLVADPITAHKGQTYFHEGSHNFRPHNLICFDETQISSKLNRTRDLSRASLAAPARPPTLASRSMVRRLTPRECERLQGFPDDWTLITYRGKPARDGPRYRAIGNSMAVPVMRWIGERIAMVESILR